MEVVEITYAEVGIWMALAAHSDPDRQDHPAVQASIYKAKALMAEMPPSGPRRKFRVV